jgi:hypothetical protein
MKRGVSGARTGAMSDKGKRRYWEGKEAGRNYGGKEKWREGNDRNEIGGKGGHVMDLWSQVQAVLAAGAQIHRLSSSHNHPGADRTTIP